MCSTLPGFLVSSYQQIAFWFTAPIAITQAYNLLAILTDMDHNLRADMYAYMDEKYGEGEWFGREFEYPISYVRIKINPDAT